MIIFKKVQTHIENTCDVFISKFLPTHIYLPSKSFISYPYQYLFALFLKNNNYYYFSVLSYPKFTYVNQKSFQHFNKTSSKKKDQAHCSNQIQILTDPNSQSFQHLLHNKPTKVDHNLISFQTVFTLDEKSCQQNFFNDSLTFNSYDVCSRLLNAKFIQKLQRRHNIEQLPVKKRQADESIVKRNTLTLFEL